MSLGQVVPSVASQLVGYSPSAATTVVAWGPSGSVSGGAAVVTGYDAASDSFAVISPLGQHLQVLYDAMASLIGHSGQILQLARAVKQ
jgi:hypothetical protein